MVHAAEFLHTSLFTEISYRSLEMEEAQHLKILYLVLLLQFLFVSTRKVAVKTTEINRTLHHIHILPYLELDQGNIVILI